MTRFALAMALAAPVMAAAAQDARFDDAAWARLVRLEAPVPSPDGRLVAFTRFAFDSTSGGFRAAVWVMEDDGREAREVGPGRFPDWSPDSRRLAMTDDGAVRVVALDGTVPPLHRPVQPWSAERVRWSPDGAWIGVAARAEGRGTILVLSADGTASRIVTTQDFSAGLPDAPASVRSFDWIDAATLVVAGRFHDAGRPDESALVVWDTLGSAPRVLPLGEGVWDAPVVSPNGRFIAFTGHRASEAGWTARELWVVQPNGAGIRRLTPNLDQDALDVAWAGDSESLWFATESRGARNVHRVTTRGDGIKASTSGVHHLVLGGIARRGGYGVVVREQPLVPPAIWRFPTGKPWELRPIHEPNADVLAGRDLGELEEFEFRAPDGVAVHAWLLRPPGFTPDRRHPLLLEVHGGPHAMAGARFAPARLRHAAEGWLVLVPNARGSTGFGSDFANAVARAWPGADGADLLAAVDDALARGLADSTRLAILGVGGGGVAVGALLAESSRFRFALLRCTGSRWLALGGGPDAAPWGEWGASDPLRLPPALWLSRSPVHRAHLVRTPLLTVAGVPDALQPVEFAEMFTAAVARTDTRVRFVRDAAACAADGAPWRAVALERAALATAVGAP